MKIKLLQLCLLIIQIGLISYSISELSKGNHSAIVYFNIVLNSIFGVVNLIGILS